MKNFNKQILVIFILLSMSWSAFSQTLRLEDCVNQALKANYGIQIAKNNELINSINYKNYTQFMPSLYGDASQRSNYSNSFREDANGNKTNFNDVNSLNAGVGVSLNWRIFDGLSMFFTNSKNKTLLDVGTLNTVLEIEQLISNVSAAYYNVWIQQKLLEAAENIVEISNERYKIALNKYQIGSLSGLEFRQSKIDLNADSSVLMLQNQALTNAYINLNTLMNSDLLATNFVHDTLVLMPLFNQNEIVNSALANNSSLLISKKGIRLSELEVKNSMAQFFPTVDFGAGYQFSYSNTPASISVLNQSSGFFWGFTARIPIFSRMENHRNIKTAKVVLKNTELESKDLELRVLSSLAELFNIYKNNHILLNFETENVQITEETLEIAIEKYRIGTLSGLEFREFQRAYIESVKRLMNASYQAKVSEIGLQLLSGKLK